MFIYNGDNSIIKDAMRACNGMHEMNNVYKMMGEKESFDMATAPPAYIADKLREVIGTMEIEVVEYKPKWRWSKAYGYYSADKPFTIHINYYKSNRSLKSFIGTFFHEAVHMADHFDQIHKYGHGDNSNKGKENTAPYWIGNFASSFHGGKRPDFNNVENASYKKKKSIWGRIKALLSRIF